MTDAGKEMLEMAERGQFLKRKIGNQTFTPIVTEVMGWINEACVALRSAASAPSVKPDCAEIERATIEGHYSLRERFIDGKFDWQIIKIIPEQEIFIGSFGRDREVAENAFRALSITGEAREGGK